MTSFTDQFRDEGWAVVPELFSPTECAEIEAALGRRTYPEMTPEVLAWATDERWAGPVLDLVGSEVRLLRDQLVTKYPGSSGTVPWHQDAGFTPVGSGPFLTCFVALGDQTEVDGCLWVDPGSHLRGSLDHVAAGAILRVDAEVSAAARPVPLARGSVLCFSSLTLHFSGPNEGRSFRPAWIVQFSPVGAVGGRTGEPSGGPVVAEAGVWRRPPDGAVRCS